MVRFSTRGMAMAALYPWIAVPAVAQAPEASSPPSELSAPADAANSGQDDSKSPFAEALSAALSDTPRIAEFYREAGYEPLWTDADDADRRAALRQAFAEAGLHGLPQERFDPADIESAMTDAEDPRARAEAEVALVRHYLRYGRMVSSGVLDPQSVHPAIKREAPRPGTAALLERLAGESPEDLFESLPPNTPEYARLREAKERFEGIVGAGGWGEPVEAGRLERGDSGPEVATLRARLVAMGYLEEDEGRSARAGDAATEAGEDAMMADGFDGDDAAATDGPRNFDDALHQAVRDFQQDHGIVVDGIVGPGTLSELNASAEHRLGQVVVAMERERWLNIDRGDRHVWVNIPDFHVTLIDDGEVTFETRSVVGDARGDRQTPEFSDVIEHMVINPTWHIPRSIAVEEYMPQFKQNPAAHPEIEIHYQGEAISRSRINWPAVTAENWPFALKQPPAPDNALGRVKFMFPNRWNIYLHDTPAKGLFSSTSRAYSHGCIRLNEPFEFAFHLLAPQTSDPQGLFHRRLDSGREITEQLESHVPVHLVYRTAFTTPEGKLVFRPDIYGRDTLVLDALREAGLTLAEAQT